jgi:ribonucleoside-diphosphate reductase alpha chain
MSGRAAKVRRLDGTLVPVDVRRIEGADARTGRETGCDDPKMPATLADALGSRVVPIEQIEDFVEARLGNAGLDCVARAIPLWPAQVGDLWPWPATSSVT